MILTQQAADASATTKDHAAQVLASLLDRRQEADNRLKRLYDAIEAGSLDPAEPSLGECIAALTALRDQARG